MKENILITGGAGYIGSHIVRDLGENDLYHPVIYDNLSTGKRENILYGDFIEGDTGDEDLLDKTIKKYKIKNVIHFAASIVVPESVEKPIKYYQNNTSNAVSLIKVCINNQVNNFVFSSTAAVYGIPAVIPVTEESPLAPINPYGVSKMFTEQILKDTSLAHPDFNYVALRYFNVAGADEQNRIGQNYTKPTHLITLALRAALLQIPQLYIFGTDYDTIDGTAVRDYIHIDDLSDVHLLALEYLKKENKNRIFNCGYGRGFSVRQVVDKIKEVTQTDFLVVETDRRPKDPPTLVASNDLIKKELLWKPRKDSLEIIIKTSFEWEKKLLSS